MDTGCLEALKGAFVPLWICPSLDLSLVGCVPLRMCPSLDLSSLDLSLFGFVPQWICPSLDLSLVGFVPLWICRSLDLSLFGCVPLWICPSLDVSLFSPCSQLRMGVPALTQSMALTSSMGLSELVLSVPGTLPLIPGIFRSFQGYILTWTPVGTGL